MPVIRIPDPLYKRLQAIAEPFVDTPVTVIERLLNEYEGKNQFQKPLENESYKILDPDAPGKLNHTKVFKADIACETIYQTNWNRIVDKAHELAVQEGMSIEDLLKFSLSNVVLGENKNNGFHYVPSLGISVQGVDANYAWRNTLHLIRKLGLPIEIYFEWRNKEGVEFSGEKAKLAWAP